MADAGKSQVVRMPLEAKGQAALAPTGPNQVMTTSPARLPVKRGGS